MTVVCHHCDLDDELGFSVNTLTRAAKLFDGGTVNSKVPGGNSTGVHLCTHGFVKHDKDRKTLGTDQVRFLPFADSKEREPNEPTDFSGWVRWQKKSHAVVDKTSPLLAGIRALPSFQDCATTPPGSLNDTDHKIAELQKKIKKKVRSPPSQDAADANVAADTACAAAPTATTEDPSSQDAVDANITVHAAAATTEDPSSHKAANIARPATAAVALTSTKDPPSQDDANAAAAARTEDPPSQDTKNTAAFTSTATKDPTSQQGATKNPAATPPIPPGYWNSPQAKDLFQPRPVERVEACLERRVELFNSVLNDWSRLDEVLEGGEDTVSRLADHQKQ
jgi:hypothetical protein